MRPTARACSLALPAVVAAALAVGAAPVHADSMVGPFDFGSFDFGGSLGSSKKGPQHYGKLGRPGATNGVKSINTWVYSPSSGRSNGSYPVGSRVGVKWNAVIDAGDQINGPECQMSVRITQGPRPPGAFSTKQCTSKYAWKLNVPGEYVARVTDAISGASNAVRFTIR